ncbi:hypothetical protein Aduo_006717 [Ancylostoma duodenale]
MHIAILFTSLILASHARSLTEQRKGDVKEVMNKRSETESAKGMVADAGVKPTGEADSNEAVEESTGPAQHVRRMKSLDDDDDDDHDDDDDKVSSDRKRLNDDDSKQQSKARLPKVAANTVLPDFPQLETKEAASPNKPLRSAPPQTPSENPSAKLPEEAASFPESYVKTMERSEQIGEPQLPILNEVKDSGKGGVASEETRPKPNSYHTKDPSTRKEHVTDEPIGNEKLSNKKLEKIKFDLKEDRLEEEEDDGFRIPILDRDDFLIR